MHCSLNAASLTVAPLRALILKHTMHKLCPVQGERYTIASEQQMAEADLESKLSVLAR